MSYPALVRRPRRPSAPQLQVSSRAPHPNRGDRAFYLEAWEGDGWHRVDRIGREPVKVRLCLALYGGIQPGALARHVAGAKDGRGEADGLLQRFGLAVWPDPLRTYRPRDRLPDVGAREDTDRAFERLAELEAGKVGARPAGPGKVPALRFAPDAQPMFTEWHNAQALRVRRNDDGCSDAMVSHLSKHRGLMPALALLIHLLDLNTYPSKGIDRVSTGRAEALVGYLEHHAAKIYGERHHGTSPGAATLAEMIIDGEIKDGASLRDVYRRQRAGLGGRGEAQTAARELEGRGWLRLEHGERRSLVIRLRPDLSECLERFGG